MLLTDGLIFKKYFRNVQDRVERGQVFMLACRDQSLLVLILRLQLFLPGDVTDVTDDKKLAVHVTEHTRLDADF